MLQLRFIFLFTGILFSSGIYSQPEYFYDDYVKGQNPLIYYAYKGDTVRMKELINEDYRRVNKSAEYYPSQTFTQNLGAFLTLGFTRNKSTVTPLEAAVEGGKKSSVRLLLTKGASSPEAIKFMFREDKRELIYWMLRRDSTCMYEVVKNAVSSAKLEYVKLVIEKYKLDPNARDCKDCEPLLLSVAKASSYTKPKDINTPVMNYIMSLPDLDINVMDADSNTACMLNYKKFRSAESAFIKLLAKKGAELNSINKQGYTLLDMSRKNGNGDSTELKQLGATRSTGNEGYIALERGEQLLKALQSYRDDVTIKKMITEPLPVKLKDPKKLYEIVRRSVQSKNMDALHIVRDLPVNWNDSVMDCSCDCRSVRCTGGYRKNMSYLQCSIWCKDTILIKFLAERGADLRVRGEYGNTALHLLVEKKSYTGVKLLLERGGYNNILNKFDQSPLYIAFKLNDVKMAELLLKYGADINERVGIYKLTLRDYSREKRCSEEMRKFIKANGGKRAKKLKTKKS